MVLVIEDNVDWADMLGLVPPEAGRPGRVGGLLAAYADRPPT